MTYMTHRMYKTCIVLVFIFLVAAFLRVYHLSFHDAYTDEVLLAFRGLGMIDYDAAVSQTTPWQWFDAVPAWARLSFHDHPILFFLIEHATVGLFGENLIGMRAPAVLAGLGSIMLLFLIGRKLWNGRVGIMAAAILAVQSYHVWVSRVGLQDGVVIFFILASLYALILAKDDARWWYGFWIAFGLGVLTKLTALVILPLAVLFFIVYRVSPFAVKAFWRGGALFILITAPWWLYNIMLYRARGHFDFQLSALFGQPVPEWTVRLGRQMVGGLGDRLENFFHAWQRSSSLVWNGAALAGVCVGAYAAIFKRARKFVFLLGVLVIWLGWFLIIGSTYRFVVMMAPTLALLLAVVIDGTYMTYRTNMAYRVGMIVVGMVFFLLEAAYAANSFLLPRPYGRPIIHYAFVNEETQNLGFNQLGKYLEGRLAGKVTAAVGRPAYQFMVDLQNKRLAKKKQAGAEPLSLFIIYDQNINFIAGLWYLQRHLVYDAWPVMKDEKFLAITGAELDEYYRRQGIEHFIYIQAAAESVRRVPAERQNDGKKLEESLALRGVQPQQIKNRLGEVAFLVYEF